MKKILITSVAAALALGFAAPSFADGKNWDADKQYQIEVNRMSDAGIGNGGEIILPHKRGLDPTYDRDAWENPDHYWTAATWGEDGGWDLDPGNSFGTNNACPGPKGGTQQQTDC